MGKKTINFNAFLYLPIVRNICTYLTHKSLLVNYRLSFMEHEFKLEYLELRKQCQDFATALLDHTRSSYELEVLLNHDPTGPAFEHGERMHLNRLKLAIKLRQKKVGDLNPSFTFTTPWKRIKCAMFIF